jgi:hypothetical protein
VLLIRLRLLGRFLVVGHDRLIVRVTPRSREIPTYR